MTGFIIECNGIFSFFSYAISHINHINHINHKKFPQVTACMQLEMSCFLNQSTLLLVKTCRLLLEDKWPCEETVTFDGSRFSDELSDQASLIFFDAVLRHGKARSLSVKRTRLSLKSDRIFKQILTSVSSLQKLELCNIECDGGLSPSYSFLDVNASHLQDLKIEKCKISSKTASVLATLIELGTLQSLKLTQIDLRSTRFFHALARDGCSLDSLELREAGMDQSALSALFQSLASNQTLKSIRLEGCAVGSNQACELAQLLSTHPRLRSLSLCNNDLDGKDVRVIAENGLRKNTTLRKLELSHNPICDSGAEELSRLLCHNSSIESLSLVDCEIWSTGFIALARRLAKMKGLKQLVINDEICDHANIVLQSLKSNFILTQILTDRTPLEVKDDCQWKQVDFYLMLNRSKRRILIEPGVPFSLWPLVLSDQDASTRYHFLRDKPELTAGLA